MKGLLFVLFTVLCLFSCKKNEQIAGNGGNQTEELGNSNPQPFPNIDVSQLEKGRGIYRGRTYNFYIYEGAALIEGDLLIPLSDITIDSLPQPSKSVSPINAGIRWPNNQVFYKFSTSYPLGTVLQNRVLAAINQWQTNTNLTFTLNAGATDVIEFGHFNNNVSSSNSIGRKGGTQEINLVSTASITTAVHEIGHAVGLYHEHTRPDRDSYINIDFTNIPSGWHSQFAISPGSFISFGGLDFNSVMLYPSFILEANNPSLPIMTTKGPTFFTWGANLNLSQNDISGTTLSMYPKRAASLNDVSQGSGSAIGDINGNGIPDLILMANDNPPGVNQFRYRVLFDLNNMGRPLSTSSPIHVAGVGSENNGAGCVLADLNNNGIPDLIIMADEDLVGMNEFRYKVAFDLNSAGVPASVSATKTLPGTGHFNEGCGIAVANIDSNPLPDLIFAANDAPSGPNYVRYKIAFNVNSAGDYASATSSYYHFTGVGDHQSYSNIAVADFNGNGRPDLLFLGDDNPTGRNQLNYRIAYDLNTSGNYATLGGVNAILGLSDLSEGVAVSLGNIDNTGSVDMVVSINDAMIGPNEFKYVVGLNLGTSAITANWR